MSNVDVVTVYSSIPLAHSLTVALGVYLLSGFGDTYRLYLRLPVRSLLP